MQIDAKEEIWPLRQVFRISRGSRTEANVVVVSLRDGEHIGRGEGAPIKRYNQSIESVLAQIEPIKREKDLDRNRLQQLLPPGAARNALDCALWDLEAKQSGKRVWELPDFANAHCSGRPAGDAHAWRPPSERYGATGSEAATANRIQLHQVETSFTISLDTPDAMSAAATAHPSAPILKLKLGGDDLDLPRVESVRTAAPNARLIIDANESWSVDHYRRIVPRLKKIGIELIEQPFPADADEVLENLDHPIPVCADESCHTTADLPRLTKRYDAINVKLDKTGGLTEALCLCARARESGFKLLIGCMVCTSLGIAPARLLAAAAEWVDLDGPLLLARDREHPIPYTDGQIGIPPRELWG
jgi:L-alanine-DL-glutamate epimerase-like enolase superfamily enzyme